MQGQTGNTRAERTPMALLNLERRRGPFVTRRAAPLQFCRSIPITFGKATTAARFGDLLHLFERQPSYPGTSRTPAPFLNGRWNRVPEMTNRASPEERNCRIDVERGKALSSPRPGERYHRVKAQLLRHRTLVGMSYLRRGRESPERTCSILSGLSSHEALSEVEADLGGQGARRHVVRAAESGKEVVHRFLIADVDGG